MSKQWSDLGAEGSGSVKNGSWDGSAAATDQAPPAAEQEREDPPAATVDLGEAPAPAAPAIEGDVEPTAATDLVAEPVTPDGVPEPMAADVAAPTSGSETAVPEAAAVDEGVAFLSELARAMQATAASERVRIGAEIEQRRAAHVDRIRARQSSEADRMRELAAEELQAIDGWAEREIERIREERAKRAAALDEDLTTSLAEHGAQTDAEVARIESAIASYRAEVDAFFADLDGETDIVVLAQRATQRPVFPDLDLVANGMADSIEPAAVSEPPAASDAPGAVGVMDPTSIGESAGESWEVAAEQAAASADEPAGDTDALQHDGDAREPVAVGADEPVRKSLFQSVQVVHPTSWLHRNRNGEDDPA